MSRAKLGAYEGQLFRGHAIVLPERADFEGVSMGPGATDLLVLTYQPRGLFRSRSPVHEEIMIELAQPLAELAPGEPLRLGRLVYRAGTDRGLQLCTRGAGEGSLVEHGPAGTRVRLALRFAGCELDFENRGDLALAGEVDIVTTPA